ncbi:hypothetical protein D3C72_2291060 [compost metagenome]
MVAPAAVGAIKAATGSFTLSLYLLSLALVLAAVILVTWFRPRDAGPVVEGSIQAR